MENTLVNKWFISFEEKDVIKWTGLILGEPHPSFFLIQLRSAIDGSFTDQIILPFNDLIGWQFYSSSDDMAWAYTKIKERYKRKLQTETKQGDIWVN